MPSGATAAARGRHNLGESLPEAFPCPASEVSGGLRKAPLTRNSLRWAGWQKIVQAADLPASGTLFDKPGGKKRADARAATGAVNTPCAVVNRVPASLRSTTERES